MKGLDLCRQYYFDIGRPLLYEKFPEVMPRCAAGLVGDGSECLGYDDDISQDHDFGPGFCLWLTAEDFRAYGAQIQEAYDSLPDGFLGYRRQVSARGGGRVGVMEIHSFYSRYIGQEQPPKDLMRWLYLPEDKLCQVSAGEVFEDPLGEFSAIREVLRKYYPEDVRIKKIAACAARMAQSGQYNYGRLMLRQDTVAASIALDEFLRNAMKMIWLFNKRYAPYYKWTWHGLNELKKAGELKALSDAVPLIRELSVTPDQSSAWEDLRKEGKGGVVNTADRKVALIEEICRITGSQLRKAGLSDCREDFLELYTWDIMSRIRDERLSRCHVMEG